MSPMVFVWLEQTLQVLCASRRLGSEMSSALQAGFRGILFIDGMTVLLLNSKSRLQSPGLSPASEG